MLDDVAGANGIAVDFHGINPSEPWTVSEKSARKLPKWPSGVNPRSHFEITFDFN
jgi:hypothetical protein